jgi:hypothetical protein
MKLTHRRFKNAAGLEGGKNAGKPDLRAVARAGANVTAQWSGIIKMHDGPSMTVSLSDNYNHIK